MHYTQRPLINLSISEIMQDCMFATPAMTFKITKNQLLEIQNKGQAMGVQSETQNHLICLKLADSVSKEVNLCCMASREG